MVKNTNSFNNDNYLLIVKLEEKNAKQILGFNVKYSL